MCIKFLPLCGILLCWLGTAQATGWDGQLEQLRFRISWWLVPGADAVMQAAPDSGSGVLIRVHACTNPALDLFHKVRDTITVRANHTDGGLQAAQYQERITEGRYRNYMEVSFPRGGPIVFNNQITGIAQELVAPPGTMDLLTAFYVFRGMDLHVGNQYEFPVVDNYKAYNLSIEVLAKETRATLLGDQTPTVIIRPLLQSKGVFKRDGAMRIWLTDDQYHLPVHVSTKVSIGSIHADLIGLSHNPADAIGATLFCEQH